MKVTDPHAVLIAHDRWANGKLYEACRGLSEEQFHQEFEMGCGSIHENLVHNLGAMRSWTDVLNAGEIRPWLDGLRLDIDGVISFEQEVTGPFEAAALQGSFDDVLTPSWGENTRRFTRGGILTHVMTHSMHHRAQCLNMLRKLGVEELPRSSVVDWMDFAD
ncbi:MAG: DinB family protein [Phycisphaerales bacterium]